MSYISISQVHIVVKAFMDVVTLDDSKFHSHLLRYTRMYEAYTTIHPLDGKQFHTCHTSNYLSIEVVDMVSSLP